MTWNVLAPVKYETDLPKNPADDDVIYVMYAEPGNTMGYVEGKTFVGQDGRWMQAIFAGRCPTCDWPL